MHSRPPAGPAVDLHGEGTHAQACQAIQKLYHSGRGVSELLDNSLTFEVTHQALPRWCSHRGTAWKHPGTLNAPSDEDESFPGILR